MTGGVEIARAGNVDDDLMDHRPAPTLPLPPERHFRVSSFEPD